MHQPHLQDPKFAPSFQVCGLQEAAGADKHLIRVMPNTPCLVGETASAMCLGGKATEDDAEVVRTLFSAVGKIFQVDSVSCSGNVA